MGVAEATIIGDGSSPADRPPAIVINLDDRHDRWRYRCPRGHTRWEDRLNHVYCKSCADDTDPNVDCEHADLLDVKTGEMVAWSRVQLVRDGGRRC